MKQNNMEKNKMMIMLHRFDEARWIKTLINGQVSFSCIDNYLKAYQKDGNIVRGDTYEGFFAHLPRTDVRVQNAIEQLGKDLEIIDDGNYVYLRRYSIKRLPVFCIYMICGETLIKNITNAGVHNVDIIFDSRLVEGFSNCESKNEEEHINILTIKPEQLITPIFDFCSQNGIFIKRDKVTYRDIHSDFYIKPTNKYDELFNKDLSYEYQQEERLALLNQQVNANNCRFNINLQPFEYIHISPVNMRMNFEIEVSKIDTESVY